MESSQFVRINVDSYRECASDFGKRTGPLVDLTYSQESPDPVQASKPSVPTAESREPRAAACANRPTHRPSYTSAVGDYRTGASEQQEQQSLEHLRVRIVLWRALVQHALVRSGRRTVTSADSPIDSR